jgi:diacylglycerol kinase family enzyme
MTDPLRVLVNASAGPRRGAGEERVARALGELDIPAVIEAVEPDRLGERVRSLAGTPRLAVAGGDGTQRTAASELAGTETTLVPFPTGTLNHFARRLGLDSVSAAARAARAGRIRTIPVGRVGDHVFLNTAIAGAYPRFVELRSRLRPYLAKWPAAVVASGIIFVRWPRINVSVRSPSVETHTRTAMVWVGVGPGSFPVVHASAPPEGDAGLEAVVLTRAGRRGAFTLTTAAARRRLGWSSTLEKTTELIRADWLELEANHHVPMALDGEPFSFEPPVRIRYHAHALRVPVADPEGGGLIQQAVQEAF